MMPSPNPEEIAGHADENRTRRCHDRREEIVDSEARKKVRDNPPDNASACAGDMELPKTRPGRAALAKHPAIVDQETQDQGRF
jgi:hypothetical protein